MFLKDLFIKKLVNKQTLKEVKMFYNRDFS